MRFVFDPCCKHFYLLNLLCFWKGCLIDNFPRFFHLLAEVTVGPQGFATSFLFTFSKFTQIVNISPRDWRAFCWLNQLILTFSFWIFICSCFIEVEVHIPQIFYFFLVQSCLDINLLFRDCNLTLSLNPVPWSVVLFYNIAIFPSSLVFL